MSRGRVLIVEHEEWEAALLAKFLREADYEVHVTGEARAGFDKVRELLPDCILCDVNLPDIDGFWVARRVRTEASAVSTTPFLFLIEADDPESRLQGLNVGADLYLTKPFHDDEVVAQVGALIDMARRLRAQRDSFTSDGPPSAVGAAFQGDLAQMSVATVLTLLELERRSGSVRVRSEGGRVARLEVHEGTLAAATLDEQAWSATELLREVLRWKKGSFSFRGAEPTSAQRSEKQPKIGGVLLEAMRLEDESRR